MGVQYGKVMKVNHQIYERYCWYQITKIWGYQRQLFLSEFIYVIKFTSKTHLCFILISLKDSFDWRRKKKHCLDDTQKHCKPFSSLPSSTRPRKSAAGLGYDLYPPPTPPQKALLGPAMVSSCLSLAWSWAWATLLHHSSALLPAGLEGVAWLIYFLFIWFFFILFWQYNRCMWSYRVLSSDTIVWLTVRKEHYVPRNSVCFCLFSLVNIIMDK